MTKHLSRRPTNKLICRITNKPSIALNFLPQAAGLASLEAESEQAGEALAETVRQGEKLLGSIQAALHDIANRSGNGLPET